MTAIKVLIRIGLILGVSISFGYYFGSCIAKADELPSDSIERIGIFTQPNGIQLIEICKEDEPCKRYKVKTKDMMNWELPEKTKE